MILQLVPKDYEARDLNASYPLKKHFWALSVAGHIAWVAVVIHIPLAAPSRRPIFDQFIRPLESKTLIYRPPKKSAEAKPETRVGKSEEARGKIFSPRTAIATAPKAQSQKQIVITPAKLPEVKVDVAAPNLVARIETALPPPPPKAQPKQFTAPAVKQAPKAAAPVELTDVNLPQLRTGSQTPLETARIGSTLPPPPKVAPKQFVPPPSRETPKLPTQTVVAEANLPQVVASAPATQMQVGTTLPARPKVVPKQFSAPAAATRGTQQGSRTEITATLNDAPVAGLNPNATTGLPGQTRNLPPAPPTPGNNDQANIAIASVNPSAAKQLPASPRSGEFSTAPVVGAPSSGNASPGAIVVPNLTVREPEPPKPAPPKTNPIIYAESVRASSTSAFTIPLRPANRSIPRAIESRFTGRDVYATVIPIEKLPAYGGDWILWFAEATPPAGPTQGVRAPLPYRKLEAQVPGREAQDTRLQIAAKLRTDGKLQDVRILSNTTPAIRALAEEDVTAWEWKPAMRNGVPVEIDAVFEIPFRLPVQP